jgi:PAS domain S-box-containing protein
MSMAEPESPQPTQFRASFRAACERSHRLCDLHARSGGQRCHLEPGAERFKGYSSEEIVGQHFSRFFTEEDRAVDLPGGRSGSLRGKALRAEGWRLRKDGSRFWASAVLDPIRDTAGTLIGYAKITRDITHKKEPSALFSKASSASGCSFRACATMPSICSTAKAT